jgi:hypothetical protein
MRVCGWEAVAARLAGATLRRERLHIAPLDPAAREADRLITSVMRDRGYPIDGFEQRAADISVDHPQVVDDYRAAHAIAEANDRAEASTEDLRQALVHYRSLFEELLEVEPEHPTDEAHHAEEVARSRRLPLTAAGHPPTGQFTTRCLEVDGLTAHRTTAQQVGQAFAELGLGGRSDADVGLWARLVIATLVVLDEPIVLSCRVLEHPEGIAGRADPRLRFAPPAQVPVPYGRLVDGQLGQRKRLQPLVRNGPTAKDRGTVGARRQASLRPLQGAPPVTQPLAQGLAGLLGEPAVGAFHRILRAGHADHVVVVARHCPTQLIESATLLVQQGSRSRLVHPRSSSARTRQHRRDRTDSQNRNGMQPNRP